jgi:hypothetical protein
MKLVISIDVEEEGLFSGDYPRVPKGVANVGQLQRLEFIPREFGLPLTLLVSYHVARDKAAAQVLKYWRDRHHAEIGAHLHPWNTPPFPDLPGPEPVPSELIPLPALREKMGNLVGSIRDSLGVTPRSFRMGRFDWGPKIFSLLPEMGLQVDSSIFPLTQRIGGPQPFLAPTDPFRLPGVGPSGTSLLEVPPTMAPVIAAAPRLFYRISTALPAPWGERLRNRFHHYLAAGIHPAWYPLPSMRLAALLHRRRGGKVFTMFFHSTEIAPGCTPNSATEEAVHRLVGRIRGFLTWLRASGPVQGVTLSELEGL